MAFDTLEKRQRVRLWKVGRGVLVRLDECPGVDFVEVLEPAEGDEIGRYYLEPGSVLFRVWSRGDPKDVVDHVYKHAPAGVLLLVVVYPTTRLARLRAWLRVRRSRREWKKERRALKKARARG